MKYLIKNEKIGIYKIVNTKNGKVYIGKTKNFYKRFHQYKHGFKTQCENRINSYLLRSFNKYGFDNFIFEKVESFEDLDEVILMERELFWMDDFDSCNREKGYNLRRDSSTGMMTHESTSKKITERLKKEWASGIRDGHSQKLKDNWKNNPDRGIRQSKLFSEMKTKYIYKLYDTSNNLIEECKYARLKELKLQNCCTTFSKKKTDKITFKNYIIHRIKI